MADTLKSDLTLSILGSLANSIGTGAAQFPFQVEVADRVTDGTTAGKADKVWYSQSRALTQNTGESIDLHNFTGFSLGPGNGLDALGNAITLAEVVAVFIRNTSSAAVLLVGGEGTGAAWSTIFNDVDTSVLKLLPGAFVLLYAADVDPAYPVADTTNHLLAITEANVDDATYDIFILGRSA